MVNLAKLRKENDLTQKELAEKNNISKSSIAMYESGKRVPSLKKAKLLADFFDVSIDYICYGQ